MMPDGLKYVSRNYRHRTTGGARARTDIELVLKGLGAVNTGLPTTFSRNGLWHGLSGMLAFVRTWLGLRRGDVLVLQYPMSPWFTPLCRRARRVGASVIALIHDLNAFRLKQLTPEQEVKRLSEATVLLTHNVTMRRWLADNGCKVPMTDYDIMDYLHGTADPVKEQSNKSGWSLYFVGNTSVELNGFLYELADLMPNTQIYLYGGCDDTEHTEQRPNVHHMGLLADTAIIERHQGDIGLGWYGLSLTQGVGTVGEYMYYNNPHKIGLYLRCHTPVVVNARAGRAEFLRQCGVAIEVDSLEQLPGRLETLTPAEYESMVHNASVVASRLRQGYYLKQALKRAYAIIQSIK